MLTGAMNVDGPGEYEVKGAMITGVPARLHIDEDGHRGTAYSILMDGVNVVVTGNISGKLDEDQVENLGQVDVLVVPVGGTGLTLDAEGVEADACAHDVDDGVDDVGHEDLPRVLRQAASPAGAAEAFDQARFVERAQLLLEEAERDVLGCGDGTGRDQIVSHLGASKSELDHGPHRVLGFLRDLQHRSDSTSTVAPGRWVVNRPSAGAWAR